MHRHVMTRTQSLSRWPISMLSEVVAWGSIRSAYNSPRALSDNERYCNGKCRNDWSLQVVVEDPAILLDEWEILYVSLILMKTSLLPKPVSFVSGIL